MVTDIDALKKAVKLVADAISDAVKAAADPNSAAKLLEYQNLVPDVLALLPVIGEIPVEAKDLSAEDLAALVAEIGVDLALPVGKTEELVKASLKLLSDIALVIIPDVAAVIAATKA